MRLADIAGRSGALLLHSPWMLFSATGILRCSRRYKAEVSACLSWCSTGCRRWCRQVYALFSSRFAVLSYVGRRLPVLRIYCGCTIRRQCRPHPSQTVFRIPFREVRRRLQPSDNGLWSILRLTSAKEWFRPVSPSWNTVHFQKPTFHGPGSTRTAVGLHRPCVLSPDCR